VIISVTVLDEGFVLVRVPDYKYNTWGKI
jgi:hypothetical protein